MTPLLLLAIALVAGAPPAAKPPAKPKPTAAEQERAEAAEIRRVLRSGPLPAPVTIAKEATVGATMGAEVQKSPLDGCEAKPSFNGGTYRCAGEQVAELEDFEAGEAEVTLAEIREVLKSKADEHAGALGGTAGAVETRKLGGEDVPVVQVVAPGRSLLRAAVRRAKGVRVLSCARGTQDRCAQTLELLLALPFPQPYAGGKVPGTRPAKPPDLKLGGRRVPIPAGCFGDAGASEIWCARGKLSLESHRSEAIAREAIALAMKTERLQGAREDEERLSCRIGGRSSACRRLRIPDPDRPRTLIAGVVPEGAGASAVICLVDGLDAALPPPCAAVFELR